jgi:Bax protein
LSNKLTFERGALAFLGLCVVTLYGLAATGDHRSVQQRAALPPVNATPAALKNTVDAIRPKVALSAKLNDAASPHDKDLVKISVKPMTVRLMPPSAKIRDLYKRIGYRLDQVREHGKVPRVFLASLPGDIRTIQHPAERKSFFIKTTLPLILRANETILRDRQKIIGLRDRADGVLTASEKEWLARIADQHGMKNPELPDFKELLQRVDVIPPSLALAQSAEESGWGTSRFAREGNALFGQRTWRDNAGLVPEDRAEGEKYKVRAFKHLLAGVRSYARNLNGHFAYGMFRKERALMRAQNGTVDGSFLAGTLGSYSERGDAYIETIRLIIRVNNFSQYDRARLSSDFPKEVESPDA